MLVKIAVPVVEGRLSGHFGEAKSFAVVEVDRQSRAAVSTQILAAPAHEPGSFPRWLREQGVQVLIVANNGMGRRALDYLVHHGIEVRIGQSGAAAEKLVTGYFEGRLPAALSGCNQQHGQPAAAQTCRLGAYLEGQPANPPGIDVPGQEQ